MGRKTDKEIRVRGYADGMRGAMSTLKNFIEGGTFTVEEGMKFVEGVADQMTPENDESEFPNDEQV